MADFFQTVKERVVVYDGAMGTNIQKRNPTLDDFWGKENCSEVLVLSRPDIIRDIHADFLRVGCDIVESTKPLIMVSTWPSSTTPKSIPCTRFLKN